VSPSVPKATSSCATKEYDLTPPVGDDHLGEVPELGGVGKGIFGRPFDPVAADREDGNCDFEVGRRVLSDVEYPAADLSRAEHLKYEIGQGASLDCATSASKSP
jgi:hypothetical protein